MTTATLACEKCGIHWSREQNHGATREEILRYHNQLHDCDATADNVEISFYGA